MINILRAPDDIIVYCDGENTDAVVSAVFDGGKMLISLKATESRPKMICLRWNERFTKPVRIMGDKWERGYGDMEWRSLNGETFMPWYFLINDGDETVGCGVKTGANSFVSFQCDASGVTAWLDVRCGGVGVELRGRELIAAAIVCESYKGITPFEAAKEFCGVMCDNPIFPREAVYGSNNWYYAYGKSSYDEIMADAKLIARLAGENKNRPFMVIDDGWQKNPVEGPWEPNEKYGDMKKVVDGFGKLGLRAGIWVRPLHNTELETKHPDWCFNRDKNNYLDPSHPEVKKYIYDFITRIRDWGFELIKHDYSTFDIFGDYGFSLNSLITNMKGWSFYDKTKTSAEIVLDFYRLIREASQDMYIIGCNTVSHLCAGLVEINRIGNDTSGKLWSVTRANGINSLAFRMCQNDTFYKIDADCVGLMEDNIDWRLNRQWLDLVAKSGSPLFVSMQPSAITPEMEKDLKAAFKINSKQKDTAVPIDWTYNNEPQRWLINGVFTEYDFVMDSYPAPLKRNCVTLSPNLIF